MNLALYRKIIHELGPLQSKEYGMNANFSQHRKTTYMNLAPAQKENIQHKRTFPCTDREYVLYMKLALHREKMSVNLALHRDRE